MMAFSEKPLLSIVVPVYRNRETLILLADRLRETLIAAGICEHELLFVNDACPDGSFAVLQELAYRYPTVGVVDLDHNVGQQRAVLTGMRFATGAWICVMDGDLQDPPEVIPELFNKARAHGATVFATRRGNYQSSKRMITSKLYKVCLAWAAGVPYGAGMFFIIPEEVKHRLVELPVSIPYIPAMLGFVSARIEVIPVYRNIRPAGSSSYTAATRIQAAMRAFQCTLQCRFNRAGAGRARHEPAAVRALIGIGAPR